MNQADVLTIERLNKELETLILGMMPAHPLEWECHDKCGAARKQLGTIDTKTLFKALSQGKLEEDEPEKPCTSCDGRGSIEGRGICTVCHGSGKVPNVLPGFEKAANTKATPFEANEYQEGEHLDITVTEFVDFREGQSTEDPKFGVYVDYKNGAMDGDIPVVAQCSERGNSPREAVTKLLRKMNAISPTAKTVEEILASLDGSNFPDTLPLNRIKKAIEWDSFELAPETLAAYLGGGTEEAGAADSTGAEDKPKRHRRTKAEIEADAAAGK